MGSKTEAGRAERMVRIFEHLVRNRNPRTIADVINFLQADGETVLRRNVERDMKSLIAVCGDCIGCKRSDGRLYYSVLPDMREKLTIPIARNGLLAFFLLKRLQRFFAPTAKTFEDMENALTDRSRADDFDLFEDMDDKLGNATYVFGEQSPLALDGSLMSDILTALVKQQKLQITYTGTSDPQPKEMIICPVKLVMFKGELYFLCCSERHEDRDFYIKLCRIMKGHVLAEKFVIDPERRKRVEKRLADSFGILDANVPKPQQIVCRFPHGFKMILSERHYHHSQQITELKNGDIQLSMNVPVDLELVQWVLGWVENVTVVKPVELKKKLADVGTILTKRYSMKA